jgi:Peptidase U49/Protein of unknown function (DUF2934)
MPSSPLVDLKRYIYAAPFASAPGKARDLWAALAEDHPLVMVEQPGFWFRAYEKHVELSFASVDALWSAAYCYYVLCEDRVVLQRQSIFPPLVLKAQAGRDAIELYRWFLARLQQEDSDAWPSNAPRPTIADEQTVERVATELFLVALAFVLHHEFGHLLLQRPVDETIPTKVREWEADAHATKFFFEGTTDLLVRRKLFCGACVALGFLGARRPPTQESNDHPPPFDRLHRVLEQAGPEEEEQAYAFALNVLLTNWAVQGHETWIQVGEGSFKELLLAFGSALRHETQQTWVRIDEQAAQLYERFVLGPIAEEEQRTLAYVLWEERGQAFGSPQVDWYGAERMIRHARWFIFLNELRS